MCLIGSRVGSSPVDVLGSTGADADVVLKLAALRAKEPHEHPLAAQIGRETRRVGSEHITKHKIGVRLVGAQEPVVEAKSASMDGQVVQYKKRWIGRDGDSCKEERNPGGSKTGGWVGGWTRSPHRYFSRNAMSRSLWSSNDWTVMRIFSLLARAARHMASAATLTLYGCLMASMRSMMEGSPRA